MTYWVWWSRDGAEQGKPWRVRRPNGEIVRASLVSFDGNGRTVINEGGFDLPDGPRGVIEVDGEVTTWP